MASEAHGEPPFWVAAAIVGALAATRFLAISVLPGEIDEAVLSGAVTHFDLFDLSPQAPGYPLWILIGRALVPLVLEPYTALVIASTVLSALAMPAFYGWGRRVVGGWAALAALLLSAAVPVVFVNGGRAFTDSPSTALFLVALALIGAVEGLPEGGSGRAARLFAIGAGLAAAAGAGIRPHLVLAFGPVLALYAFRLVRLRDRRDAAVAFLVSGVAGSGAWGIWLAAQAGGLSGLLASFGERIGFRADAQASAHLGGFVDTFFIRDALSPGRALLLALLSAGGIVWLAARRRAGLVTILTILLPLVWSLWFLHGRTTCRYSVPFVFVASLLVGAGVESILRRGPLVFIGGAVLSASYFVHSWPEARWSATHEPPVAEAMAALERYVHPGRETIVADDVFQAFLRTERWQGHLVAWGYLDSELVSGFRQANARYVRLADFTDEVDPPDRRDPVWHSWYHGGRIAERLAIDRLLAVAVRDPAPPLFGPGFGLKEKEPGRPSFRWAGPKAHLIVPGLDGPPVAILSGVREGSPTELTVTDDQTGARVVTRKIDPGLFDLVVAVAPVYGPLPRPRSYTIGCDHPTRLPPFAGGSRPSEGCFVFREATFSIPPEKLWQPRPSERFLDLGARWDDQGDPQGFWDRETIAALGVDMRWTSGRASVLYVPVPGFFPSRLVVRCRPPFGEAVGVRVRIGDADAGTLVVPPGDFAAHRLDLTPLAAAALRGHEPLRIELSMPVVSPKQAGKGDDPRPLGIGVDWIALE